MPKNKEFEKFIQTYFPRLKNAVMGSHIKKALYSTWLYVDKRNRDRIKAYENLNNSLKDSLESAIEVGEIAAKQINRLKKEKSEEVEKVEDLSALLARSSEILSPLSNYTYQERMIFLTEIEEKLKEVL